MRRQVALLVLVCSGCSGRDLEVEQAIRRGPKETPVLVGNDGFLSSALSRLAGRLARETGATAAVEPALQVGKTVAWIKQARAVGRPVILMGYSAGCRDVVTALERAQVRVRLFLIEPTYQTTPGYKPVSIWAERVTCFRVSGGSWLTFSGRDYRRTDFVDWNTPFENLELGTHSHLRACADPQLYHYLVTEIGSLKAIDKGHNSDLRLATHR